MPGFRGWSFFHLTSGVAYWMHPRANHELAAGSSLICSEHVQGVIRASQLGGATLQFFHVQPERLTGVVTLSEQQALAAAGGLDKGGLQLFDSSHVVSQEFHRLCQEPVENPLRWRVRLLDLFVGGLGSWLMEQVAAPAPEPGAQARLEAFLKQMPAAEMVDLDFVDLAASIGCSPRHLGRLFQQVVGMSFREKQTEVRLARAQELLATTASKMYEVALESGYPSLSLFNLMFKKRFGTTPAAWRLRVTQSQTRRKAQRCFHRIVQRPGRIRLQWEPSGQRERPAQVPTPVGSLA
jgi:AraC-like DNA-binding protein